MDDSLPRKRQKLPSINSQFIHDLPPEILIRILHFLDLRDILSLMQAGGLIEDYISYTSVLPKEQAVILVRTFHDIDSEFGASLEDSRIKFITFDGERKKPGRDVLSWIQNFIKLSTNYNPTKTLFIVRNVHEIYINSRQIDKGFTTDNIIFENIEKLTIDYWTGSTISFKRPFVLEVKDLEINIGTRHFNLDLFDWEKSELIGVSIYADFDEPQTGFRRESRILPVQDLDGIEELAEGDDYRIDSDDSDDHYQHIPPNLTIQNTTWNMKYLNIRWTFPSVIMRDLNFPNLINLDIEITDTLSVNRFSTCFKSLTARNLKSFVLKNFGNLASGLFHGFFDFGETLDYLCIEGSVFDHVGLNEYESYQDQICTSSFDTSFFNSVKKFYKVPGIRLWNEEIDLQKVTFDNLEELITRAMVDEFNKSKVFTTFQHSNLRILKLEYFYVFDIKDPVNTTVNFTMNAPNLEELEIHGAYSADVERFPKFKIDFTNMKPFPLLKKLLMTGFCTELRPFHLSNLKELHVRDVHDMNCRQEVFTIDSELPKIETITLDYSPQMTNGYEFKTHVIMNSYELSNFKHNDGCIIFKKDAI